MWQEFKKFAFKGNVMDMAIGVIIGGAFGSIVNSLVNDIIMPFFGFLTAGMDFKSLKWVLSPAEVAADGTVGEGGSRHHVRQLYPEHRELFNHCGFHFLYGAAGDQGIGEGGGACEEGKRQSGRSACS